jgi:hypothetical protein
MEVTRMTTSIVDDRELIAELSKQIVDQVAPEEADLFDELIDDYFADPSPPDLSATDADDALGFGLGELMVAFTPAAAAVASAAIAFVVSAMTQAARDESAEQIRAKLKQLLVNKGSAQVSRPQLTPSELEQLRKIARDTASLYGMDAAHADSMANAMLVTLVLGQDAAGEIPRTIKILFLSANPKGTVPLRLDEEIRSIDEALRASQGRDRIRLEQQWAVRVSDLQGLLLRYRPDIVHFSGHGSPASSLILEDAAGRPQEVPPSALADLFGVLNDTVRCVVLNACYSHAQASAIAQHVDAVIGMTDAMGDRAAVAFAAAFYQALGYDKDVSTAFKLGITQLSLNALSDYDVPRLLLKPASAAVPA